MHNDLKAQAQAQQVRTCPEFRESLNSMSGKSPATATDYRPARRPGSLPITRCVRREDTTECARPHCFPPVPRAADKGWAGRC